MSTRALAQNSILQVGSKFLGMVFGLVTFYLLLHYFGTEGYGYFTIAITHVTIFAILVDFGLTLTTTQMISEAGVDEKRILGNLLTLRLLSAGVFMSLAPLTALFIPQSAPVMGLIIIASFTYFFGAVAVTFVGVFQKRLQIGYAVIAETAGRFLALVGVVVAGVLNLGLNGAAIAFLVANIAQLALMLGATHRLVKLTFLWETSVWKDILLRSWPIGLSIFFNLLYLRGDIFFLWIFNRTAEEIGHYGSAYKVVDVITIIPYTLMGLVLPLLTNAWSERNTGLYKRRFQQAFDSLLAIAIPFGFGSVILGVPLMTAIKPDLTLAGQFLMILGPTASIVFLGSLYGHAIVAVNKQKIMTLGYIAVAVLTLSAYIFLIPRFGGWAAAWASLGSEFLITILTVIVVTRVTNIWPNLQLLARVFVSSLIMSLAIVLVPLPHVALSILWGVMVYIASLAALGGPKPQEILKLFRAEETTISP